MSTSRQTVTIAAGGYTARVALRGGQLLSLTSLDPLSGNTQNLIVPAEQAGQEGAFAGAVLAPWPNRIVKASYVYGENRYQLPVTDEATGSALNGLIHHVDFSIQHQRESEIHLAGVLEPAEGYPFRLEIVLIYRVSGQLGLTAALSTRYTPENNDDDTPAAAPFGGGFHPYLTAADAPLKSCRLRLPAGKVAKTKTNGKVIGSQAVAGDLDLSDGPLLAGLQIDRAYTGLPAEGWTAELLHGPSGFMVRMIADTPWAQVYTGESINRAGVAVAPVTCPPNAFNTGKDLIDLSPGVWHRVGYSLEAFRM